MKRKASKKNINAFLVSWKLVGGRGGLHVYEHNSLPLLFERMGEGRYRLFDYEDKELWENLSLHEVESIIDDYS